MWIVYIYLMIKNKSYTHCMLHSSFWASLCDVRCGSLPLVNESYDRYMSCHVLGAVAVVAFLSIRSLVCQILQRFLEIVYTHLSYKKNNPEVPLYRMCHVF